MTSVTYENLVEQYMELYKKVQVLQGQKIQASFELQESLNRLKEADQQLRDADAAVPRWYGP